MSQLVNKKWMSKRMEEKKQQEGKVKKTVPNDDENNKKKYNKGDKKNNSRNNNSRNNNSRNYNSRNNNSRNYNSRNYNSRNYNSIKYVIKMSNLPNDISVKELNELILPWGHIGNINFGKSHNNIAYIDFFDKSEAEYFVKAIDRTPFDNLIIGVQLLK